MRHPFQALVNWDSHWYREIAAHGYLLVPGHHSDPAFFPLMGILLRGVGALGLPLGVASLVVANAGMLLGLLGLYELARTFVPEPDARRAAIYATLFPYSFIFSMGYPEGPALAAMAWAGVAAVRGRWGWCALAAAAATLLRPEGLFVAIPIAAIAARRWPAAGDAERARAGIAVL